MKEVNSTLSRTFEISKKEFLEKLGLKGKINKINHIDGKVSIEMTENILVEEVIDDGKEDKDRNPKD